MCCSKVCPAWAAASAAGTVLVADAGVRGYEGLDYRSAVEQLAAGRRLAAWLDAGLVRLTHRIGQTAIEELPPREPGTPSPGRAGLEDLAEQSVIEELACLYRITEKQARGRYETAQDLCEHYPGTLAALTAGDLDLERAGVITRQGDTLPDGAKPGFEQALLGEAPDKTPGELQYAARKQREKLNPETITVRRERQEKCRGVYLEPAAYDHFLRTGRFRRGTGTGGRCGRRPWGPRSSGSPRSGRRELRPAG